MEKQIDFDVEKYIWDRYEKFKEDFAKPEKNFSEMSLEELRSYVTMFNDIGYSKLIPVKPNLSYEEKSKIQDLLNAEFDKRVGSDFVKIYNLYDKDLNAPEKWGGDIRYKLLSYKMTGHSYTEMSNFLTTYKVLWFAKERNIKIDDIIDLFNTISKICYWELSKDVKQDSILKTQIIKQVFTQKYDKNILKEIE